MSLGGDGGDAPSHPGIELDVSPVPLGSKGVHDPCVKWLVVTVKRGARGTTHPRKTYKNLGRETVNIGEKAIAPRQIPREKLVNSFTGFHPYTHDLVELIYVVGGIRVEEERIYYHSL